jgi:tetratricopeptide (TPR) repeat protein/transcriptional regulator with XRE-family HTH domain
VYGQSVREYRRRLAFTQEDLSGRTGISVRHIRDIENGRVTRMRPTTARLLADAFGLCGPERDGFCTQADTGPVRSVPAGVPAQLPADVYGFAGRAEALARLDRILAPERTAGERPPAVIVTAVSGTAGVGKTALAVHWAHRVADRFPDGQLYLNLRGFDPSGSLMTPDEAMRGMLDGLQVPPDRIPSTLGSQVGLYRTLLAGKRMLIVLDNVRDADQVRPLLPGTLGCLVLITSRIQLSGLVATEGAQPLALDLFTDDEARQLIARRLGPERVERERDAVDQIIARCARLPLALGVATARAATSPQLSLATLATELAHARDRLDAFAGDDPMADVRAVFSWSYRTLDAPVARLFRLLALRPGDDITAPAAASLARMPVRSAQAALTELVRNNLLTEPVPGRYSSHDLLHAYAGELAGALDPERRRREALGRVFDHYLRSAEGAARLLDPTREVVALAPPRPGTKPEALPDYAAAMAWFEAEQAVLLAALARAADAGFGAHVWQLAWTLSTYLDHRGLWHDYANTQRAAVTAAAGTGDRKALARAHHYLAHAETLLGHFDAAHHHFALALDLYRELGDRGGEAHTRHGWSLVYGRQGRNGEAVREAQLALTGYRKAGLRRGEAIALNTAGWYHTKSGDFHKGLTLCRRALAVHQEIGNTVGEAATWDSLGYAYHQLGRYAEAVDSFERSLVLWVELDDHPEEAATLTNLGNVHEAAGRRDAAHEAWRKALAILDGLDPATAEAVRARLR